ncbi:hypothetical protein BH09MYX1_BH09MYX1_53680 [soil metagenome]
MWLQATFTTDDLNYAINQFCPAHVEIDEGRWIDIARPTSLKLIPNRGVRLVTEARLRWTVIGIDVPITILEAEIFFEPKLVMREEKQVLTFGISVGDLDLKFVPHLLDKGIAATINAELSTKAGIEWDFMKTLDFHIPLPKQLSPVDALHLHSKWAEIKVRSRAISLVVSFGAEISRTREIHPEAKKGPAK